MTTTSTNTNNVRKESSLKKVPITHLECHGRESSNAQVLTNVAEHCEGTRNQRQELIPVPDACKRKQGDYTLKFLNIKRAY
jgi:hypothetical protein